MNNLSEEKIIIECNKLLITLKNSHIDGKIIQILYDLYEQEKKKNKELKVLIEQNLRYSHNLEKDLFENCSNYVVSKDKIKEIIYPTPTNPISYEIQTSDMYRKILQLLEEK